MQGLSCERLQCDEIWSFVGAKAKHVKPGHPADYGDVWTWIAIDADTKLVPCWYIGGRTTTDARLKNPGPSDSGDDRRCRRSHLVTQGDCGAARLMRQGWRGVPALVLIVAAAGVGAGAGAKVARNGLTTATLIGLGVALLLVAAATVLGRRAP